MGEHDTFYTLLMPEFWHRLNDPQGEVAQALGRDWQWMMFGETHFTLLHVVAALITCVFLVVVGVLYKRSTEDKTQGVVPPRQWTLPAMANGFIGACYNMSADVMGEEKARKWLPFVGTLALFIFVNNIQGLIPGLLPPTDTLKTNLALAVIVFVVYNAVGLKENGMGHLAHLCGPKIGNFRWLFPLMLPIEIASHLARPVSLSLRLMGNILADHKVVGAILFLVPLLVPVPFLLLGVLVAIVQTVVFTLLTVIYIGLASEHEADH
jgi:F-type H+-transporting ATPase subunit a